jgi:two-component system, NarL family, sensor kinase
VRTVSHLLHPPILDALGLRRALEALVEGYSRRGGIGVRLDLRLPGSRLDQDLELALYRIVQECLINVHRHSGSASAQVLVGKNGHSVYAEVRDRGHGMPKELVEKIRSGAGSGGVGLSGLRERVHELQGELEITSSKRGTTVRATIPIDQFNHEAADSKIRSKAVGT